MHSVTTEAGTDPVERGALDPGRVSVIIANYNYADYVSTAIESALALDHPDVEVIVVDDGSTDESRAVIESYGDRIQAIFQENLTQRVARNRGFAMSTGEFIVHLDADDALHPQLMRRIQPAWRPGVTKVQVQMRVVDGGGRPTGALMPRFRRIPSPDTLRRWVEQTSAHPTPPGSGNVYSRAFMERIFPLDDRCGPATDSACLIAAPLLGDVITIKEPLVDYRVHGENTSNLLASPGKFVRYVERGKARWAYGRSLVAPGEPVDERPLFRSRELLQLRVAAARMSPDQRPLAGDGRVRMGLDAVRTMVVPGPESAWQRSLIATWCLLTLAAPRRIAERLIQLRYAR